MSRPDFRGCCSVGRSWVMILARSSVGASAEEDPDRAACSTAAVDRRAARPFSCRWTTCVNHSYSWLDSIGGQRCRGGYPSAVEVSPLYPLRRLPDSSLSKLGVTP
jgi:hypothetical protein